MTTTTLAQSSSPTDPVAPSSPSSFREEASSSQRIDWHVYVDQSKASLERGAGATLDAFWGLAPPNVQVHPSLLDTNVKKNKLPIVRCLPTADADNLDGLEVTNVDSVDKVYRILVRHMKCRYTTTSTSTGDGRTQLLLAPQQMLECLKWKYKANSHLEANELTLAINAYDKALEIASSQTTSSSQQQQQQQQEGPLLLLRASAYLKRSQQHKKELQRIFRNDWKATTTSSSTSSSSSTSGETGSSSGQNNNNSGGGTLSSSSSSSSSSLNKLDTYQILTQQVAQKHSTLALSALRTILQDTKHYEGIFRKTKYQHGLLQYALLHAAQDALRATELLGKENAQSWLTAGEILSELWKLQDAIGYYEKAMSTISNTTTTTDDDDGTQDVTTKTTTTRREIQETINRLSRRQDILKQASTYGWSEDTWRLALDVAG